MDVKVILNHPIFVGDPTTGGKKMYLDEMALDFSTVDALRCDPHAHKIWLVLKEDGGRWLLDFDFAPAKSEKEIYDMTHAVYDNLERFLPPNLDYKLGKDITELNIRVVSAIARFLPPDNSTKEDNEDEV